MLCLVHLTSSRSVHCGRPDMGLSAVPAVVPNWTVVPTGLKAIPGDHRVFFSFICIILKREKQFCGSFRQVSSV